MDSDRILIRGLKLPVRIGCLPGERDLPQVLGVSLDISVFPNAAIKTGSPDDTVCYKTVCDCLRQLADDNEWPLLEQFAEDSVKLIFERFTAASGIRMEVRKFVIPGTDWVAVEINRERGSGALGF